MVHSIKAFRKGEGVVQRGKVVGTVRANHDEEVVVTTSPKGNVLVIAQAGARLLTATSLTPAAASRLAGFIMEAVQVLNGESLSELIKDLEVDLEAMLE